MDTTYTPQVGDTQTTTPSKRRALPVGACKCGATTYKGHLKKTATAAHVYTGHYWPTEAERAAWEQSQA